MLIIAPLSPGMGPYGLLEVVGFLEVIHLHIVVMVLIGIHAVVQIPFLGPHVPQSPGMGLCGLQADMLKVVIYWHSVQMVKLGLEKMVV